MQKTGYVKSEIRNHVKQIIEEKIAKLEKFIHFTIDASRDIKKTPKYDSIREEAQEEIYQLQKQLAGLFDMKQKLIKVINSEFTTSQLGAVVITNKARFYVSVSLGEFFYEGDRFYAISEESPMAQKLAGLKLGDEFILNKIHQKIEEVF